MKRSGCPVASVPVLFIALTILGCDVLEARSLPPDRPQPASSFTVEFVPAGAEHFPPTDVKEVQRFKNVLHWHGKPDLIRGDESPSRPYVIIGELKFKDNWYYSSNITELINTHVPRVGGDAVLVYHAYQKASGMMKNPDSGELRDVYYQSVVLQIIRYTDR